MTKQELSDAIGGARDDYVQAAGEPLQKNRKRGLPVKAAAAAAAVLLLAGGLFAANGILKKAAGRTGKTNEGTQPVTGAAQTATAPEDEQTPEPAVLTLSEAVYPAGLNRFDASGQSEAVYGYQKADAAALGLGFFEKTARAFLSGAAGNAVFSPLDLYFQLGALAELGGGESREQILALLGAEDLDGLRKTARALWLSSYRNYENPGSDRFEEQEMKLIPATSFWLNNTVSVQGDAAVLEALRENYFTSFYKGDPEDEAFQAAYRGWISKQTEGLLDASAAHFVFDPGALFQMTSTLLFKAGWTNPFHAERNYTAAFHAPDGDREAIYMYEENAEGSAYEGETFVAFCKGLSCGSMWFFLPEAGGSVNDLLESGAYLEPIRILREGDPAAIRSAFSPKEAAFDLYRVALSVPKFDVSSTLPLPEKLRSLGVTDLFDPAKAELPFLAAESGEPLFLQKGEQDVRLMIDENGVAAASVTMTGGYGDPVFKDLQITLDRPFLAVVCSDDHVPVFIAVVQDP